MRRFNACLSTLILGLFVAHGLCSALALTGAATTAARALSHTLMTLVALHVALGCALTVRAVRVWRETGAPYFRRNALFWGRRLSGLTIMVLIVFHMTAFGSWNDGVMTLAPFTTARLVAQLLLVASLALHIIANVRPMLIALGVKRLKPRAGDLIFIVAAALLLFAGVFIVYYLRQGAARGVS